MPKQKHKRHDIENRVTAPVTTIVFEDNGQDFLEWDINESGEVVDCRPFQGWVWTGVEVLNAVELKPGAAVTIRRKDGEQGRIIHRVQEVRR